MLGPTIKNYMEEMGIKQTFLADKTGIKLQDINAILNGDRKIEANEYYDICATLDKQLEFFFSMDRKTNTCSIK